MVYKGWDSTNMNCGIHLSHYLLYPGINTMKKTVNMYFVLLGVRDFNFWDHSQKLDLEKNTGDLQVLTFPEEK